MDHSTDGTDVISESCSAVDNTGRHHATNRQVESASSTTIVANASDAVDEGARQDSETASELDNAELSPNIEVALGSPGGGAGGDATAPRSLVGDGAASPSNCPPSKDGRSNGMLDIETGTSSQQSEAATTSVSPQPIISSLPFVLPPPPTSSS